MLQSQRNLIVVTTCFLGRHVIPVLGHFVVDMADAISLPSWPAESSVERALLDARTVGIVTPLYDVSLHSVISALHSSSMSSGSAAIGISDAALGLLLHELKSAPSVEKHASALYHAYNTEDPGKCVQTAYQHPKCYPGAAKFPDGGNGFQPV